MARKRADPKLPPTEYDHIFACHFRGLSADAKKAGIGVSIQKQQLKLALAGKLFTDANLEVQIAHDPNAGGDLPDQKKLIDDAEYVVRMVANVTGFRVNKWGYRFKLDLQRDASSICNLFESAGLAGTLSVTVLGPSASRATEVEEEVED